MLASSPPTTSLSTMSSIKKAISKVVHNHSRTHSKSSSTSSANGDLLPFPTVSSDGPVVNGHVNGSAHGPTGADGHHHVKHVVADQTGGGTLTAAQRQQEEANGTAVPVPVPIPRPNSINVDSRNLSFTEQKEDRRAEREAKDEELRRVREAHMQRAHAHVRRVSISLRVRLLMRLSFRSSAR